MQLAANEKMLEGIKENIDLSYIKKFQLFIAVQKVINGEELQGQQKLCICIILLSATGNFIKTINIKTFFPKSHIRGIQLKIKCSYKL